jgi:hypothetical protein
MWQLRRVRRLPWRARLQLFEAVVYLSAARVALKLFSFARLTRFFNRLPRTTVGGVERDTLRAGVQWAIGEAKLFLPGETVCFPQAIAAQVMLRRRGISSTLYYGAATLPTRKLKAHVWLQDGPIGIVGHETAQEYHILAQYPQQMG